jgi:hypothetical protein
MTLRSRTFETLLVCGLALGSRSAYSEPSAAEMSTARQAFEAAVALEADQKWVEASVKLHAALAVKDTPGLRFHLAHCEEQLGLLVEAAADYDRASELLGQGAKAPDVQKLLVPASEALKRRIPRVSVEIPADIGNPVAQIDGKAFAQSELSLGEPLNPGRHELKISAVGRSPFENSFVLKEGDAVSIHADLKEFPAAASGGSSAPGSTELASAPARADARPKAGMSPKAYLLIGESAVTVAGLALGIGYTLAESSARSRVQADQSQIDSAALGNGACGSPDSSISGACSDLRTSIDAHDRDATLSTVGFVCAGVGAAALLTTWFAYPNRTDSAGLTVQPVVALGRIGVRGAF